MEFKLFFLFLTIIFLYNNTYPCKKLFEKAGNIRNLSQRRQAIRLSAIIKEEGALSFKRFLNSCLSLSNLLLRVNYSKLAHHYRSWAISLLILSFFPKRKKSKTILIKSMLKIFPTKNTVISKPKASITQPSLNFEKIKL